jgi:ABC-2 type transport system permease protein
MVATLVKLRFLLLINGLKKSPWQIVAVVIGGLYGLGALAVIVAGLFALSFAPLELARTVVVLVGALVIVGWTILPALTSGIDETVDPGRLAVFPVPIKQLMLALAVSGVLGVPGIITLIASLATALTWWDTPLAAIAAIITGAIGTITAVVGSRMLAALASRISRGRRSREAQGLLVFIPLVLAGPIIFGVSNVLRTYTDVFPSIAEVVSWTPVGAIWAVPSEVASGNFGVAGLKLLIGLVTLAAAVLLWRWGLERALERPAQSAAVKTSARGTGFFGRFPATPWGAVAARALTYWIRDPRYAQSLVTVPLIPLLFFFYGGLNGNLEILVWVGPVIAVLLAMSIYTDVSYDNTAFALHLQTGCCPRHLRGARLLPARRRERLDHRPVAAAARPAGRHDGRAALRFCDLIGRLGPVRLHRARTGREPVQVEARRRHEPHALDARHLDTARHCGAPGTRARDRQLRHR